MIEMDTQQAMRRIEDHMEVHKIGEAPHILIAEALNMAIEALRKVDNMVEVESLFAESMIREQTLKDRCRDLEEALLDMTVQFSSHNKQMKHSFMSAEESAYDVLDIEYGEKISDVYDRYFKKWGGE